MTERTIEERIRDEERTILERMKASRYRIDILRNEVKNYFVCKQEPGSVAKLLMDSVCEVEKEDDADVYYISRSAVFNNELATKLLSVNLAYLITMLVGLEDSNIEEPFENMMFIDVRINYTITLKSTGVRLEHTVTLNDLLEFVTTQRADSAPQDVDAASDVQEDAPSVQCDKEHVVTPTYVVNEWLSSKRLRNHVDNKGKPTIELHRFNVYLENWAKRKGFKVSTSFMTLLVPDYIMYTVVDRLKTFKFPTIDLLERKHLAVGDIDATAFSYLRKQYNKKTGQVTTVLFAGEVMRDKHGLLTLSVRAAYAYIVK